MTLPRNPTMPAPTEGTAALLAERRAQVRYRCERPAVGRVFIASSYRSLPARIFDLSAKGIGLLTEQRFEPGTRLNVELEGSSAAFEIVADVVHATAQPDGGWLCGCALVWQLSDDELRLLLR
jgi:hypothetical protein